MARRPLHHCRSRLFLAPGQQGRVARRNRRLIVVMSEMLVLEKMNWPRDNSRLRLQLKGWSKLPLIEFCQNCLRRISISYPCRC